MKLSTVLLLALLGLLAVATFVVAQEEGAAAADQTGDQQQQQEQPNGEVPADKPNPWKPTKLSGLAIGENSALAVPVPILIAIFLAFLAAGGYGIFQLLDSDKARQRKLDEAKARREAKNASKGSKKK